MALLIFIAVRTHVQDLVAVRPEIAIFQAFYAVVGLASSTTSVAYVNDPELKFLEFI